MKQPTIAAVIDKNKIASDRAWLFAMEVRVKNDAGTTVETLYLVNNSEAVTLDGQSFDPLPFSIDKKESAGDLNNIQVTIADQTRIVQTRMQQYQGMVGSEVDLMVALVDAGTTTGNVEVDLKETYTVIGSSTNNYASVFDLGAVNLLNNIVPARMQSKDRCSFRYKSTECGYTGGMTSCDFTLDGANGCVAHSNEERFGGYPGLTNR